jgi:hypothetical protein
MFIHEKIWEVKQIKDEDNKLAHLPIGDIKQCTRDNQNDWRHQEAVDK